MWNELKDKVFALFCAVSIALILVGISVAAQSGARTISFGTTQTSLSATSTGAVTGTTFALPSGAAAVVSWQIIHSPAPSAFSASLQASLDGTNFNTIDTSTTLTGEVRTIATQGAWKFLRINQNSRTGGTTTTGILSVARGWPLTSSNISGTVGLQDGTLTTPPLYFAADPDVGMYRTGGAIAFGLNGSNRLVVSDGIVTSSALLQPSPDANRDLGSSSLRWKDYYGSGNVIATNFAAANTSSNNGYFGWGSRSKFFSDADGNIRLNNSAATDFGLLQFGGTTNAFPALKRDGAALRTRLADDSGGASMIVDGLLYTGTSGVELTGIAFASLGTASNGRIRFCTDCTNFSNPCTGGGTGAIAKRLNGAWDCR